MYLLLQLFHFGAKYIRDSGMNVWMDTVNARISRQSNIIFDNFDLFSSNIGETESLSLYLEVRC